MRLRGAFLVSAVVAALFGAALITSASSGHTNKTARSHTGELARFSDTTLRFRFPEPWHVRTRGLIKLSSHGTQIVALSPQPMHRACKVYRHSTGCHEPVSHLRRDSLLTMLYFDQWGSPTFRSLPGKRIMIGGITGKWAVTPVRNAYPTLGATKDIDVYVPANGHAGYFYVFSAQIRGPHTARMVREFHAVVRSVRWRKR